MMSFVERLYGSDASIFSEVVGYSSAEIDAIGRLYNIEISGQLLDFLSEMGRYSGGGLGDDVIPLYRARWRVRDHFFFQAGLVDDLINEGATDFLHKPFVIGWLSETQFYFVQTLLADSDMIFHYDSNVGEVCKTQWDVLGFLRYVRGEMLPFYKDCTELLLCRSDLLRV